MKEYSISFFQFYLKLYKSVNISENILRIPYKSMNSPK